MLWLSPSPCHAQEGPGIAPRPDERSVGPSAGCYGEHRPSWALRELLVALSNPVGAESQLQVGRCWPLPTRGGILFDLTNVEAGYFNYLSPSYVHQGVFASIAPLSVLVLRLEVAGIYVWPLPLPGGSYFARTGYDDSFASDGIDHDVDAAPDDTAGLNISFSATLQAAVTLTETSVGRLELLVYNTVGIEHWRMGSDRYSYNIRKDAILARSDLLLTNSGAIMLGIPLRPRISLRVGVVDMLLYGFGAGRVENNQVGGIVTLYLERRARLSSVQPFVQVLGYTSHASRRLELPVDVMIGFDLAALLG